VALSSGAVLFVENFHVHLAFEGSARVNNLSVQGRFSAVHASAHVLMFGASLANRIATWCGALAQSGLSVKSSQRANQRRQSAIR
jgi:predicted LPLAT superfamily acyltransferase